MAAKTNFYGWKLVGVLWSLDFLNMGFPLYGGTVINTYMLKEIGDFTVGSSANVRDWFGADSRGGVVACIGYDKTVAVPAGFWRSCREWHQLWNNRASGNNGHAMVQTLSRKGHGGATERVGVRGILCRSPD